MSKFHVWRDGDEEADGADVEGRSASAAAEKMALDDFGENYFESGEFWVRNEAGDVTCWTVRIRHEPEATSRQNYTRERAREEKTAR